MHQLLEKGVMLVKFSGRGTQAKDLEHYFAGSRHNFGRMMDDLQKAIEFIGNELTPNISLYCKGEVTSLVGLWFNFYFPNLFNATVLHVNFWICRMGSMIYLTKSLCSPSAIFLVRVQSQRNRK